MNLTKIIPSKYQKSVTTIDYKKIKASGIKYILFDLDNTLYMVSKHQIPLNISTLITKLKKEFEIIVVSNNFRKNIKPICDIIGVDFISFSMKPFGWKIKKYMKVKKIKKEDICIIGDQLLTDIMVGNRLKIMTILVDPLDEKDYTITMVNRFIEKKIIKKSHLLERGSYYE